MILHEVVMPRSRTAAIGWRVALDSGVHHGTRGLPWWRSQYHINQMNGLDRGDSLVDLLRADAACIVAVAGLTDSTDAASAPLPREPVVSTMTCSAD
jgi:hypothetical protein